MQMIRVLNKMYLVLVIIYISNNNIQLSDYSL